MRDNVFKGAWTAAVTPLLPDYSIDVQGLKAHINWLLDCGSHGVVLLGTTGEANSFTLDERLRLMDELAESGAPMNRLVAGTGCCAVSDSIALTGKAVETGFAGVLLLPPFYYKSVTDEGLHRVVSSVVEGVGSSDLRILLYHFPQMAGVGWSLNLIERLLEDFPGVVVGIKDSSGDEGHLRELCRLSPEFHVFAGSEKLMRTGLEAGGVGCISATANVTSRLVRRVYDSLVTSDMDGTLEEDHELMVRYRRALESFPFVPVLKHILAGHSGVSGANWTHIRPPLQPLDAGQANTLEDILAGLPPLPNYSL